MNLEQRAAELDGEKKSEETPVEETAPTPEQPKEDAPEAAEEAPKEELKVDEDKK